MRTIFLVQGTTSPIKTLTPQFEFQASPPEAALAPKESLFFPLCAPGQPGGRYKFPLGIFVTTSSLTISAPATFSWSRVGGQKSKHWSSAQTCTLFHFWEGQSPSLPPSRAPLCQTLMLIPDTLQSPGKSRGILLCQQPVIQRKSYFNCLENTAGVKGKVLLP